MSHAPSAGAPVVRPHSIAAGFLSYLIPGLGQIVQGRVSKGLLFMVCLLSLFHVGEAMGNWQNVYLPRGDQPAVRNENPLQSIINNRWHFAGQFWIGVAAWPAIWQFYNGPVHGMEGNDGKNFWRDYQKQPLEREINDFLVNSDKTPDLGWIYTVIAGMLNILVIYDAFAGPAYGLKIGANQPPPSLESGTLT